MESKKENIFDLNDKVDMQSEAIREVVLLYQAKYAVEHLKIEYKISKHLKNYFDKNHGPNWHCIVGKGALTKAKTSMLTPATSPRTSCSSTKAQSPFSCISSAKPLINLTMPTSNLAACVLAII